MELTIVFFIILLIGIYLLYTSKETLCNCNKCNCNKCNCDKCNCDKFNYIENLTNISGKLDNNKLKIQNYIKYKSLIFGDKPKFTNSIFS